MLDAKIASALNKIIQNSNMKKKVSLQKKKAQKDEEEISIMIYDYSRVSGAEDTLLHYADLFSIILCDEVHTN